MYKSNQKNYTSNKVVIYDLPNFQGTGNELEQGDYNIYELGIGDNKLSSLTVPAGIKVTLYEYDNFRGRSKVFTNNANLEDVEFNNTTSSLKIEKIPMVPGQIIVISPEPIKLNVGKEDKIIRLRVENQGDRPIQVGSHYHFYEVNTSLQFDREQTKGMHLNIIAGTALRFEPGDEKVVELVPFGGTREIYGFNGLVNGPVD
jgi:urease beta subunit